MTEGSLTSRSGRVGGWLGSGWLGSGWLVPRGTGSPLRLALGGGRRPSGSTLNLGRQRESLGFKDGDLDSASTQTPRVPRAAPPRASGEGEGREDAALVT